jgi:hypothetical protein
MRTYQVLNQSTSDTATGIIHLYDENKHAQLALSREGEYIAISASHGPLEIALRPRYQEVARALKALRPVEGLQTTRQIGTAQSLLSIGLRMDGSLIIRPTIVADASGFLCINLELTPELRHKLFEWMDIA